MIGHVIGHVINFNHQKITAEFTKLRFHVFWTTIYRFHFNLVGINIEMGDYIRNKLGLVPVEGEEDKEQGGGEQEQAGSSAANQPDDEKPSNPPRKVNYQAIT